MMATTLFMLLNAALFFSNGTVKSTDRYIFQALDCLYMEPENVTLIQNVWAQSTRIGVPQPGSCVYLYQVNGTIPPPIPCLQVPMDAGTDRPGYDYEATPTINTADNCRAACCNAAPCASYVWVPNAPGNFLDCKVNQPCCYLKSAAPPAVSSKIPGIVSGVKSKDPYVPVTIPPVGMRSSVPLGGIGAGSFELRADGTIHEWTVHNAGPASSAKLGVVGDMMLGVRIADQASGKNVSRILRTNNLGSAVNSPMAQGVQSMTYYGSYPLSKLAIHDSNLAAVTNLSLFSYSRFVPSNLKLSATPAVTFTLAASNPSTKSNVNISLFLSLPLPALNDCYGSTTAGHITTTSVSSTAECMHLCSSTASCASWTYELVSQQCNLNSDVPLIAFRAGWYCGVSGTWSTDQNNNLIFNQYPKACQSNNPSPLCGYFAVSAVAQPGSSVSYAAQDSLSNLWTVYSRQGSFAGVTTTTVSTYGVAEVTITLPPSQSSTVSLVFSWYFPHRDYMGNTLGNFYQNLYSSVAQVASEISSVDTQIQIITDINSHHSVFGGAGHSEPDWLVDVAINSYSHMRNVMYFRDGRWRQYEAFDCDDIDSVHNDFQRHLPYLWSFPEVEAQKSRVWAGFASSNGMINEVLSVGCLGPPSGLDVPGGRAMADVTTVWTLGVLELYQTGGFSLSDVKTLWPTVVKALGWQLSQCQNPAAPNLPAYLVSTYDIEELEKFPTTTYNSFLHLAMMKAVVALAKVVGDTQTAATAQKAYTAGVAAIRNQLWNPVTKSFRAYSGFNATFADSLYGITIAHSLGLGLLWDGPNSDILTHLAQELKNNLDAFGLQVLSGREGPMPFAGIDTTHWGMAGPTYTYASIAAGSSDIDAALLPTKLFMDNYRSRLNDQWNLAGLTTSSNWTFHDHDNGQSWCTTHYGMALTHYYAHYALAGLQVNLPAGSVRVNPAYPAPFTVPLLLAGTTGTVSKSTSGVITVSVHFGALSLPAGGLVVTGRPYPQAVRLTKNQSISWK